jgi:hypothetical protein
MKRKLKINWIVLVPVLILLLLAPTSVVGVFLYQKYVVSPEREMVIKRYDEFRAIAATGNQERIMEFIAPQSRSWAKDRIHVYTNFTVRLDQRSTLSVRSDKATVCPRPQRHFFIIPGGHKVGMVKIDGEWFMDRIAID